jgi:membrane-associated phospholipid phosphatase
MENIHEIGIGLILFLQSLGSWMTPPMQFFSFLGNEEFFLLIMPVFFWCVSPVIGLRMGLLLLISGGINSAFKLLMHGPRPYWYNSQVLAFTTEASFGAPSGHAMNAASVWGGLAASFRESWVKVTAILLIFFIGLSRLYMGVHFPHDVIVGWIFGGLFLLIFLRLERPVVNMLKKYSIPGQITIVFFASAALVLVGLLGRLSLGAYAVPQVWITNAATAAPHAEEIHPLALSGIMTNAGALLGIGTGMILLPLFGGFDVSGPIWKRALRFAVGVVGVLIIWRGLGMLLPGGENLAGYIFRYLRYALIGFWIGALAPAAFTRLGLAERTTVLLKLAASK